MASDDEECGLDKPRVGVRLDVMREIIDDVDSDKKLNGMLGEPVSSKLALVGGDNDLEFMDLELVELSDGEKELLEKRLDMILSRHLEE